MDVEFYDLTYVVRQNRSAKPRSILKSVSGKFQSGQLSAIMGPSGAGKSSLLNAVSGYKSVGVKGLFKVNGSVRDEMAFRKSSCYITQDDLIQPLMTVEELMTFAANLKLSSDLSSEKKQTVTDTILTDLGLLNQKDTFTDHLSGGQKKRLSIALELINNPPVFFLDEPTSGLDNVSTTYCVKLLHKLSMQGRTIICTIHQPSTKLFELFDNVYMIAKGQCIYQGSTTSVVSFLSASGLECPMHYNPADYIIEIADDAHTDNVRLLSERIGNGKLIRYSENAIETTISKSTAINNKTDQKVYESTTLLETDDYVSTPLAFEFPTNMCMQFYILLRRMLLQISRNSTGLKVQFIHYALCGLLIGTMFYGTADDGTQFFNHLKMCVGIILFFAYTQLMIPVLLFPLEVKLVKKEVFNRWYGITPYYAALTVSKIPVQLGLNMLFISLVYFMSGLPHELYRFALFSLIGNTTSFIAEGIGLAIGSIFNVTNGCAIGPGVVAPFLGLAIYGFDFAKDIPWIVNIGMKLSFMRCGVVALVLTVFGYDREPLYCNEPYCHFSEPKVLLQFLDIEHRSLWSEMASMFGILLFCRTICYVSLRWRFVS